MEKNANKKPRDLSWALPVILILVVAVSVLGVIAFIGDIKENTRQKTLDEYNDRVVHFTVFGDGTYSEEKPTYVIDMEVSQEDVRGVMGELVSLGCTPEKIGADVFVKKDTETLRVVTQYPEPVLNLIEAEGYTYTHRYARADMQICDAYAYDAAYGRALQKASLVAESTGLQWRITDVHETDTYFDQTTGTTHSRVSMTLAVDGNVN